MPDVSSHRSFWPLILGIGVVVFVLLFGRFVYRTYQQMQSGTFDFNALSSGDQTIAQNIPSVANPNIAVINRFDDDPQFGPTDAPVVIVAFEDFQCPFCKRAYPAVKEMLKKYGDRVLFVYRDFPIVDVHPQAHAAAVAASCAHAQGAFWPFHDLLFINQGAFTRDDFLRYASMVGMDRDTFTECLDDLAIADEVQQDFDDGISVGVQGTPTFFFNGHKIAGVLTSEGFTKVIDFLLSTQ